MYVVVARKTDELLCGGYKQVSRFEVPCICTRWMGECWVEQISRPEVTGVTFSDSDSAHVPQFLNPDPIPAILQIWESGSCSDSGYNHRSNHNLPICLPEKWLHRLPLLPKWKSDSGSGFSQIFDSGFERKMQNPAGVDSGNLDPVPPLVQAPWLSVIEILWLYCDEAQQVGCLQRLEGCPLV